MRAGELNNWVKVQQRSTAQDALGGQSTTWTDIKTIAVGIAPLYGRELEAARTIASEATHRIRAHYEPLWDDPRTSATYRLLLGTRIFNIHAAMNDAESNRSVTIWASEGMNDG